MSANKQFRLQGGVLTGTLVTFIVPPEEIWRDGAWYSIRDGIVRQGRAGEGDGNFQIIDLDYLEQGIVSVVSELPSIDDNDW